MKRFLCAAAFLGLASCAKPPPPPPPPVLSLTITGSANQNPDPSGKGTAVAVNLYQLTGTGRFLSTDVYTLMGQEQTALGGDEAGSSQQFLLAPGQKLTETVSLKPNVTNVGFAVLFRSINQASWRLTAPVAASGTTMLSLRIAGSVAKLAQ
jgi:type VI secretion system protein VasD